MGINLLSGDKPPNSFLGGSQKEDGRESEAALRGREGEEESLRHWVSNACEGLN